MTGLSHFVQTTLNPERYHGHGKKPPFFEGWYFKLIDAEEAQRYAVIPGIFLGDDAHAFIQVLNGNLAQSTYHRFDSSDFWAAKDSFNIHIGKNEFSEEGFRLQIEDDLARIEGEMTFENLTPWPSTIISPGIMGWYAWVPKMECYHGVVSLDHGLRGDLQINGKRIDFNRGRGYIEKDWGQSFPSAYVWFQSNHFKTRRTSLTASVAVIPWLGSAFRGFIIGFWHQDHLHRFATYLGSSIESLKVNQKEVMWVVKNHYHLLEMSATREGGGLIHEPTKKTMLQRVEETMKARVEVRFSKISGEILFHEIGRNLALEVQGDIPNLLAMD
jgi:hypothetical protein